MYLHKTMIIFNISRCLSLMYRIENCHTYSSDTQRRVNCCVGQPCPTRSEKVKNTDLFKKLKNLLRSDIFEQHSYTVSHIEPSSDICQFLTPDEQVFYCQFFFTILTCWRLFSNQDEHGSNGPYEVQPGQILLFKYIYL